jgi:hypothetical protein
MPADATGSCFKIETTDIKLVAVANNEFSSDLGIVALGVAVLE